MTTDPDLDQALRAALDRVHAIADPIQRQRAAAHVIEACAHAQSEAGAIRRDVVIGLREDGHILKQVADLLGMSIGRVDQIAKGTGAGNQRRRSARRNIPGTR
jgi:hypothetical protein